MAVGGGLIVVTDRWLQFKFRGKWDEWILHFHCRANMIFAFCLESCLDTSLPLVIRQRKLSSIYKRYLLKIQNTCAYRSSNIYICAGQTQQKCVSLECGQSAPTQGRLWNRFIILIKSSNTLYWQYIHFHVINFLSYIIWYYRWWFPGIITIIISYHILCTYYISIIISCLSYILKLLISSSLIYPQWRGNCVTWSGADWDCFCNQPPSCGGAGRALQHYHHYDHFPHPFFTTMIMIVNNKFFQKGRCRSPGHPGLLANTWEGLLLSSNWSLQVWQIVCFNTKKLWYPKLHLEFLTDIFPMICPTPDH